MTKTTPTKPKYITHLIYATAFALAVFIVDISLIWSKMQTKPEVNEKKEVINPVQQVRVSKEQERQIIVATCHKLVANMHKKSLAEACTAQNNHIIKQYNNCLDDAKTMADYYAYSFSPLHKNEVYAHQVNRCKRRFNVNPTNQRCVLSQSIAMKIKADFNKMEKSCYQIT